MLKNGLLPPEVEARLPKAFRQACRNLSVVPHWLDAGRFWYRHEGRDGVEYRLVAAQNAQSRLAFDHALIRAALPKDVAFDALEIMAIDAGGLGLAFGRRRWRIGTEGLHALPDRPHTDAESLSPDGRWIVFRVAGDLWLREVATGAKRRLTSTAEPHFEWAKSPDQSLETLHLLRQGITLPPILLWAPDSSRFLTYQLDERAVRIVPIVQNVADDGSFAPVLHQMRNAFAGDEMLPIAHQAIIEIATGRLTPCPPCPVTETSGLEKREAWWSADGQRVYWLCHDRFEREITLIETDAGTGASRPILAETSDHFADVNMAYGAMPNIALLSATNELVWFSQKDGFAHLYLHDLRSGAQKAQISRGDWPVVQLLHVDPVGRRVIFLAGGGEEAPDPYHRRICVAPLEGGEIQVLTPMPGDHAPHLRDLGWAEIRETNGANGPLPSGVSPDGAYLVVTSQDFDGPGESWLCRSRDGARLASLAQGHVDLPLARAERIETLAADGVTRLLGTLWRPRNFDPSQRYPLLDMVYPGPQCIQSPRGAVSADELSKIAMAQAVTELGIAVLMFDGRGTPYRSKAFHDLCHGHLNDPGYLSDHVAAFPQLARDRPWLDLTRIGIMGHSAGGHAAARGILAYPEVYKVAVSTAGSHDLRGYNHCWPEKWQGALVHFPDGTSSYDAVSNALLADRLAGDLLLGHGDMDENVLPALTLQLADALQKAGKSYELLLSPNDDHASFKTNPWVQRRLLDYLARKLLPRG